MRFVFHIAVKDACEYRQTTPSIASLFHLKYFIYTLDVLIITRHSCEEQIRHYITKVYKGPLKIELATCEDYVGTAQALVRIKDKIKVRVCWWHSSTSTTKKRTLQKDFIVISSDLIADGSFIHAMIDAHRLRGTKILLLILTHPHKEFAQ